LEGFAPPGTVSPTLRAAASASSFPAGQNRGHRVKVDE
jgi:hypothetical protein